VNRVEPDAEESQPVAAHRPQAGGILADTACERENVDSAHRGGIGADRLADLIGEGVEGKLRARASG
jgi:hypothetical protein